MTVPLPEPPDELIVTFPLALSTVIFVPAIILSTPVFVIPTVAVLELATTFIPAFPVNVGKGVAVLAITAKLFLVLLKAVYRLSLPVDSFCNPISITCNPEIAII